MLSITGKIYLLNYDQIVKTVQNITLYCNGEESRIYDCSYDEIPPYKCHNYLGVECEAGSSTTAILIFTRNNKYMDWIKIN